MRVKKRNGTLEPVDIMRIQNQVALCAEELPHINPYFVASRAISGIYDGVTTSELDQHLIQTAAMLIGDEPEYSKLAAGLLATYVEKEVTRQGIFSFSQGIKKGYEVGLISETTYQFVSDHESQLNEMIQVRRNKLFEYFGLRTVYDRYLLKDPKGRMVIETPQYFFMRVAAGLCASIEEVQTFYDMMSTFSYMPGTPTLFNSGTLHSQMSSCYLLDSPEDSLESIYSKYGDVAMLSKFAGGIGVGFSRVRSRGSLIAGTNGKSNGIVPFLKTLDSSVAAVNQGGKRKGAACVYLETWHGDILEFLSLRDNTGDESMRTHNLNLANWIPDLFMKRLERDELWSLFDPKDVPHFPDLYGEEFEKAYIKAEEEGLSTKQLPARELFTAMMRTLAQTGNGWINFKDTSNKKGNQTLEKGQVIHLSNLCTEILEVTSKDETAVCNLGSLNLSQYLTENLTVDWHRLGETVEKAVVYLDRVIDHNFYPIETAKRSNHRWRPVGLGLMGLQDLFFKLGLPFDSPKAQALSNQISEHVYYHALKSSLTLSKQYGPHSDFHKTRASHGVLQFDLWDEAHLSLGESLWATLKNDIREYGLRNSLLIAIAPTATIASIVGAYECIEPQISNLFKRETLSGEFLQINPYLVSELRRLDLWTKEIRDQIKNKEGSIQDIAAIPQAIKDLFRTVWEIPQRSLIHMAAGRGPFIDQSQSLNLFMESPTIGKLSSMYVYGWKKGIKTFYYMRSRGATRINKATLAVEEKAALACSLENPETCESCT